jgi:hypothetical protein
MKTYFTVRCSGILPILALAVTFTLFISCNKTDIGREGPQPSLKSPDLSSATNSSASGFVTDESDEPVAGARVELGSASTSTDSYGYFELNNAIVPAYDAVVTVTRSGYFRGFKTYTAGVCKNAFFRIKLMPKTIAGQVDGNSGGQVTIKNGLKISFPGNFAVNAQSGAAYHGLVNIALAWINPMASDISKILPGDQRGITTTGEMKGLTSYGMANVELTGASGELLQVAPGSKASMTMPIPSGILANAPSSVPLWYFDETKGLWREEGSATKNGNVYTGEVGHFTIWNYDDATRFVQFVATILDATGAPMANALVKVSYANDPNNARYTYTNGLGQAAGIVPANEFLRLEVMGDEICGTPVYSQTFVTGIEDISMGPITVRASAGMATVSGTLNSCSGEPLSNGMVIMQKNGQYYRFAVGKDGAYHFTTLLCNTTATVSLSGYNTINGDYGPAVETTLSTGANNIMNLKACGETSSQFVNYTINGRSYSFTYPAAGFATQSPNGFLTFAVSNDITHEVADLRFTATDIGSNNSQSLIFFHPGQLNESITRTGPIPVNITENGTNDQVIAGNFTGVFRGSAPAFALYQVSCTFRVKCQL